MTKPLEIIHRNFQIKLDKIDELLKILEDEKIDTRGIAQKQQDLKSDFETSTLEVLGDYFQASDVDQKCKSVEKFMLVVNSQNFINKMNQLILEIKSLIGSNKMAVSTAMVMCFKTYESTHIDIEVHINDYTKCPVCHSEMSIFPAESEMRCPLESCSYVTKLTGVTFEDTVHSSADNNSNKRGAYETLRHCKYHLDRILALKVPNIPKTVMDKIEDWLKANGFKLRKTFTCKHCRRCLKDIGETTYNEYAPYIRKQVTGISPGRLYQEEINTLTIYFDKAVTAFKKIKGNAARSNLKYYPFFIYKIIEMILNKPDDRDRLLSIIDCIHFQQEKTIISNDKIWEEICKEIPEFTFRKTDTNLF
jgi:hypothetical protein